MYTQKEQQVIDSFAAEALAGRQEQAHKLVAEDFLKHTQRAQRLLSHPLTLARGHLGKNYLEAALDEIEALRKLHWDLKQA